MFAESTGQFFPFPRSMSQSSMKSFVSNNVSLLSKIVLVLRQTCSENEDEDPGLVAEDVKMAICKDII